MFGVVPTSTAPARKREPSVSILVCIQREVRPVRAIFDWRLSGLCSRRVISRGVNALDAQERSQAVRNSRFRSGFGTVP